MRGAANRVRLAVNASVCRCHTETRNTPYAPLSVTCDCDTVRARAPGAADRGRAPPRGRVREVVMTRGSRVVAPRNFELLAHIPRSTTPLLKSRSCSAPRAARHMTCRHTEPCAGERLAARCGCGLSTLPVPRSLTAKTGRPPIPPTRPRSRHPGWREPHTRPPSLRRWQGCRQARASRAPAARRSRVQRRGRRTLRR